MAAQSLASLALPSLIGAIGAAFSKSDWIRRFIFRRVTSKRIQRTRSIRIALLVFSVGLGAAAGFTIAMLGRPSGLSAALIALAEFFGGALMGLAVRVLNRAWV